MTIIAVLLAGGVLLGMGALSLDVGRILVEKRQLQNAADAAAMSLAQSCVGDNCMAGADGLATLTDSNSSDQINGIQSQCARNLPAGVTTDLPSCPNPTGALADCAAVSPNVNPAAPYVEVRTRTQSSDGAGGRKNNVSNFLAGLLGAPTSSAGACARAAWGVIDIYSGTLPLAISVCEWTRYAGITDIQNGLPGTLPDPPKGAYPGYNPTGTGGQSQWPMPYKGWPNTTGIEQYVMTHSDDTADCSFQGKDTAGGFGWLDSTACSTNISVNLTGDYWAQIQTGNAVPQTCKDILHQYWGKELLVPVFDCLTKSDTTPSGGTSAQASCDASNAGGNKTWYHLIGLATFYLSGNHLSPSASDNSKINNVEPCSNASPEYSGPYNSDPQLPPQKNPWTGNAGRCISGWFVNRDLVSPGGSINPPNGGGVNLGTLKIGPAG